MSNSNGFDDDRMQRLRESMDRLSQTSSDMATGQRIAQAIRSLGYDPATFERGLVSLVATGLTPSDIEDIARHVARYGIPPLM